MAATSYVSKDGVRKKFRKLYVNDGGMRKKGKKAYVTKNGVRQLLFSGAFDFSYTGSYEVTGSLDGDFCITFLTSGTLTITSLGKAEDGVDLFCVAGGYNGTSSNYEAWDTSPAGGHAWTYHAIGGDGGSGGATKTSKGLSIAETSYNVVVGGAGGGASSFGALASVSGAGAYGGAGGNKSYNNSGASRGADGTCAFGEAGFVTKYAAGTRFGAGGGGGYGWNNWTDCSANVGGTSGGGTGGYAGVAGGTASIPGGGGGGGGGTGGAMPPSEGKGKVKSGGAGMKGIVMMRNKR